MLLDGLTYIATYTVEDFKQLTNCTRIFVRKERKTNQLYFTYGANIGAVALIGMPQEPVVSFVCNSNGRIFALLTEKKDVNRTSFPASFFKAKKVCATKTTNAS